MIKRLTTVSGATQATPPPGSGEGREFLERRRSQNSNVAKRRVWVPIIRSPTSDLTAEECRSSPLRTDSILITHSEPRETAEDLCHPLPDTPGG